MCCKPYKSLSEITNNIEILRYLAENKLKDNACEVETLENAIVILQKQIPIKPPMDMWFMCPTCGNTDDFSDAGCIPDPEENYPDQLKWVGPTYCRYCGQSLDMSELNG